MRVRLILTFGKNPLPVLVAARRLCRHFQALTDILITPVYSENSASELRLVRKQLDGGFKWDEEAPRIEPSNPGSISAAMARIPAGDLYHLHYTGGTKVMAVHTMQALSHRAEIERAHFETTYLDPNDHMLVGWNMHAPLANVPDERKEWALAPEVLAELHGMNVPPATCGDASPYGDAAESVWTVVLRSPEFLKQYEEWKKNWCAQFKTRAGSEIPGQSKWPNSPIPWLILDDPEWHCVTASLRSKFCSNAWTPNGIDSSKFQNKKGLKPWWEFAVGGKDLEAYAFAELQAALPQKCHNSARFAFRPSAPGASKECDIDVAAVLGYQFLAVSCTTDESRGHCKQKGFEVWLRARQIGGDAARAILLCPDYRPKPGESDDDLEADLTKDIGARGPAGEPLRMLRIWHANTMPWGHPLRHKFTKYFTEELRWT